MDENLRSQSSNNFSTRTHAGSAAASPQSGAFLVVPNPKLKLMDQVKEVMRLKHYSIRTERCYSDWIRRYVKFHQMKLR